MTGLIICIVVLFALNVYQGIHQLLERKQFNEERQEFINKIMSRDYQDYMSANSMMVVPTPTTDETQINTLEDALKYYEDDDSYNPMEVRDID